MNEKSAVIGDIIIPFDKYPHLSENSTIEDAIQTLTNFDAGEGKGLLYSCLLVVNEENELVGKLTLLDILHGMAPRLLKAAKVEKFEGKGMEFPNLAFLYEESTFAKCGKNREKPIKDLVAEINFSLPADTNILKALIMMSSRKDFSVPVTENGSVVGVLRIEEIFTTMCTTYCAI